MEKGDIYPHFNSSIFNAIMMAVLFSEKSRKLLFIESRNWSSGELKIFKSLISAYYSGKGNIQKILSQINPDVFLMKMLFDENEQKEILKKLKTPIKSLKWNNFFLINLYRALGIKCMSVAYLKDGSCYLDFDKSLKWEMIVEMGELKPRISQSNEKPLENPDVIILYHSDLNNSIEIMKRTGIKVSSGDFRDSFGDYKDEITFNRESYVLDSVLLNTSTVGLNDDGKKVFNSWKLSDYKLSVPCSLKSFNWDVKKPERFCFNPNECELDLLEDVDDIDELCFNFGEGERTLIYIRKNKLNELDDEELSKLKKKKEVLTYPNIREKIAEIKLMDEETLIRQINEISQKESVKMSDRYDKKNLERMYLELFLNKNSLKLPRDLQTVFQMNSKNNEYLPKEETKKLPEIVEEDITTGGSITKEYLLQELRKNPKNNRLSGLNKSALMTIYKNQLNN